MACNPARAKSVFLAASDLASPADRAAYLDHACSGDAELRARVDALLRANDAAPMPDSGVAFATGDFAPDAPSTRLWKTMPVCIGDSG